MREAEYPEARFWSRVAKLPGDGCWEWQGAQRKPTGYGNIRFSGRNIAAHRVAWALANGPIPEGQCVLHRCDNTRCVRPDHLFLGTVADNNADKAAKGRASRAMAKLTPIQTEEIRAEYAAGGVTQAELAARYGVTRGNIGHITRGLSWTTKLIPLLAAIITLAFASAAQADTFTVDGMTADTYGQPTNGRVFMFHAMNGTRAHDENQGPAIDGLVANGYQVVAPDEPMDSDSDRSQANALRAAFLADSTEGRSYRDEWAGYTHDLIAAADARYGTAPRVLMAGQSWGGFSAMLAACQNPEVTGYVVTIPLTDPSTYGPFSDVPLSNLKLDWCVSTLHDIPGFVAWGDSDLIAVPGPTRHLIDALGPYAVTSCEYGPLTHEDSPLAYEGMVRWVQGARACLPWPPKAVPAAAPTAAATAPVAPSAAPPVVVPTPKPRARCNRSTRCESIVRRHKLFHVYNRRGKHPRWVYVRKASRR